MNLKLNLKDFACPCCGRDEMNAKFLDSLSTIQFALKKPLVINSGFRCEKHNREVGGSEQSRHMSGIAADIACEHPVDRYLLVKVAGLNGMRGIGIGERLVHLDQREDPPILWLEKP